MKPAKLFAATCGFLIALTIAAQTPERINTDAIEKIKGEASRQSPVMSGANASPVGRSHQVMDIARNLTNVYGARLTNSPNIKAAGEYARKKLVEWKLEEVHLEPWNFGNGWMNEKFTVKVMSDPSL